MNTLKEVSFDEFAPISKATWLQKLQEELLQSGKEFLKTEPGAFYTSEDILPRDFFAHKQFLNHKISPWLIDEQIVYGPGVISKIKNALQSGSDGISLTLKHPLSSKEIKEVQEMASSLKFLNFHFEEGTEISNGLFEGNYTGALRVTIKNNWPSDNTLKQLFGLLQSNIDNYRFISVSNSLNKDITDTATQLSQTLALAIEYIDYFTEREIPLIHTLKNIEFTFTIGKDFLMEISKLRAFHLLWNKVIEGYKVNPVEINNPIHCVAIPEPTNSPENLIGLTIKAMSSILGGCNSLTIMPFANDKADFPQRISRNIALLLKEESYLDKVTDPLGGAYYIEKTTSIFAEKAWSQLHDLENKGGYLKSL